MSRIGKKPIEIPSGVEAILRESTIEVKGALGSRHFDFSENSAYIQSNDGAYELIFYNSADGQQLLSASSVKDEEWHRSWCGV